MPSFIYKQRRKTLDICHMITGTINRNTIRKYCTYEVKKQAYHMHYLSVLNIKLYTSYLTHDEISKKCKRQKINQDPSV